MERSQMTNSIHLHEEYAHLVQLAAASKSGDAEAKAQMTGEYKPLLGKWLSFGLKRLPSAEREELMGELNSCFLSVLENFDPDRGINFTCYSTRCLDSGCETGCGKNTNGS